VARNPYNMPQIDFFFSMDISEPKKQFPIVSSMTYWGKDEEKYA
jgi:hypothetical protein